VNQTLNKQTRILMGMPITVEIVDPTASTEIFDRVYDYFEYVDEKFSTYKPLSEISLLNQGALTLEETSPDMVTIFAEAEQWRRATGGYFNIQHTGAYDPSGLVKGWAISNAAEIIRQAGFENYYVEAGGDSQVVGKNHLGQNWRVGIRNPFNLREIIKVLCISDCGVATSGTYIRGQHIYDPVHGRSAIRDIVSLTVIGPDIYEADCYATAAFAMGGEGIKFVETLEGFEGYMIDMNRVATFTSGFERFVDHAALD
jgi:FAD:protein FMN transferase